MDEVGTAVCRRCRLEAPAAPGARPGRWLCPGCLGEREQAKLRRHGRWLALALLVAQVPTVVLALQGRWAAAAGMGLWALLPWITLFCLTTLHELGHAGVARLLGFRVFAISVGKGPLLFRLGRRAGFEWHALPLGGHTLLATTERRAWRTRQLLAVAGGLGVESLVALAALRWQPAGLLSSEFRRLILWAVAIDLVVNLLPIKLRTPDGQQMTDGAHLLRLPTLSDEQVEEHLAAYHIIDGPWRRR